jgi:hypothetical protein
MHIWKGYELVLGGYHFLIPTKSDFHKIDYKRFQFFFLILKNNLYINKGINIFIKKN